MFYDSHLTRGELTDGDGGIILIFGNSFYQEKPDDNFNFQINQDRKDKDMSKIYLFDGGMPIASTSYKVSTSEIILHTNKTQVHESLRGRGISTQLTALCFELAIRRWRELSQLSVYEDTFPKSIALAAGSSESEADHTVDWLAGQFYLERERLEIVTPYIHEDIPIEWSVRVSAREASIISGIVNDVVPEDLIRETYLKSYAY